MNNRLVDSVFCALVTSAVMFVVLAVAGVVYASSSCTNGGGGNTTCVEEGGGDPSCNAATQGQQCDTSLTCTCATETLGCGCN